MSMYLKFRIGKDKRKLVPINGFELKDADSNNPQWLQGRQNEDGGRQVFVDLEDENGSPVNLTGASAVFKGVLPGGQNKIWDHKSSTIIDAQAGRFRYTFPKRAMAIAGSYKQAFFEIFREGTKLATLEFNFEVLADLVEENIIPSDYITPFEDLYGKLKEYLVKFNGDFEAAMTQWKKDVADLITELNADISGINLTITEIKTQLSALEDKIKADGLLTQADLDTAMIGINKTIDDIKKQFDLKFTFNPNYDVGKNTIGSGVEAFVKQINPANLNLAVITDAHYEVIDRANFTDWCDYPYATTGIDHLANFLEIAKHTDMGVVNGDNTGGNMLSKETNMADEQLYTSRIIYNGSEVPIALMAGNHDDGSPARYKYPDEVMTEEELKQTFKTTENRFDEIRNKDSLYYYKDFKDKKVRLIHLWAEDVPEDVLDNNGYKKYPRWLWHGYRQGQLNWLINSALQVPADYQTIIMAHTPVVGSGYANNDVNAHFINHDLLEGIINAFVEGSSFAKENKTEDVGDGWEATIKVDFSIQGERTLIGFFNGHTHREEIDQMYQFTQVHLMNDVCIKKSDFGTDKESAITVISVDTANKKVDLLGYGRATNRSFNY